MKQKKTIFKDSEIVEFCQATKDTNEIHDPDFMGSIGKRVIVPGMFALSCTAGLSSDFLKSQANSMKVLFNSLLSSGEFVTLSAIPNPDNPFEVRLSAFNHKDTLSSKEEYTRIFRSDHSPESGFEGIVCKLPLERAQIESFTHVTGATDPDIANFLFAVSYASRALQCCIDHHVTEVEKEIDELINRNNKISPFYQSLEIHIPAPFPMIETKGSLDYRIRFEREKIWKIYIAHVRCEQNGNVIYQSHYKLVGIPDNIILRMAKEAKYPKGLRVQS
jgi:hypothetical protein